MLLSFLAIIVGLVFLVLSSDKFVDGSAALARHFGMPSLLIGMVIVGFGTSAPELVVSTMSSIDGNTGIALGNAYGSNIANIALILGVTALIKPVQVSSNILRKELPILTFFTILTGILLWDLHFGQFDAGLLLVLFSSLMIWTISQGLKEGKDKLAEQIDESVEKKISLSRALVYLVLGLLVLIVSSRILVWGAVQLAKQFGVSDLVIGLTIVAVGTSLPELASSIIATKKGEHDIAMGNVIGSNLFNSTAVAGIAGAIHPVTLEAILVKRDILFMIILTISLFIIGYGFRKNHKGRVNRFEGAGLVISYGIYTAMLIGSTGA